MCFAGWCRILGTCERTIWKYIRQCPDLRKQHAGVLSAPRHHVQADLVDYFFHELYQSAAEPLPTLTAGMDVVFDPDAEEDPWLQEQDAADVQAKADDWNPDKPPVGEAALVVSACDRTVVGMPVRWLNHSNASELYWLFLATWDVQVAHQLRAERGLPAVPASETMAPSMRHFRRRYQEIWRKYLRFRKTSQHAQCTTCFKLQEAMSCRRAAREDRLGAAAALRQHLRDQYLDRCIYWSLRWSSRRDTGVLTIIIDSMDKAKFAWPRWEYRRQPKELEHLVRPRMVLTAALAHGWTTGLFWSDESMPHGADAFLEVLMRTLDSVLQTCRREGRAFPRHLVVVSDNTVAQAKNSAVTVFLAYLAAHQKFATTNLLFLRVGHTHEDVGAPHAIVTVCTKPSDV